MALTFLYVILIDCIIPFRKVIASIIKYINNKFLETIKVRTYRSGDIEFASQYLQRLVSYDP